MSSLGVAWAGPGRGPGEAIFPFSRCVLGVTADGDDNKNEKSAVVGFLDTRPELLN